MSNDIRDILQRLSVVESNITPASVKHGLNKQQKSVPQLPALLKAKNIKALGSKTDPKHPFAGYMVGGGAAESVESAKTALEEAMQEVEEDMISKVKRDLTHYLDKLEKKVAVDRDLTDKAKDAVEAGKAEEEIEENDYELTDPGTEHEVASAINTAAAQPQQPIKVMELDDGAVFEVHGNDEVGFVISHRGRPLPSKFKTVDDADIAMNLFKAHRAKKQAPPEQDLNQDYIEER